MAAGMRRWAGRKLLGAQGWWDDVTSWTRGAASTLGNVGTAITNPRSREAAVLAQSPVVRTVATGTMQIVNGLPQCVANNGAILAGTAGAVAAGGVSAGPVGAGAAATGGAVTLGATCVGQALG